MGTAARLQGMRRTYKIKGDPTHQTEMEPSKQTTSSSATDVSIYASRAPRDMEDMGWPFLRN